MKRQTTYWENIGNSQIQQRACIYLYKEYIMNSQNSTGRKQTTQLKIGKRFE